MDTSIHFLLLIRDLVTGAEVSPEAQSSLTLATSSKSSRGDTELFPSHLRDIISRSVLGDLLNRTCLKYFS